MEKREITTNQKETLLHSFSTTGQQNQKGASEVSFKKGLLTFLVIIFIGLISGFGLAMVTKKPPQQKQVEQKTESQPVEKKAGVEDKTTFKDKAEGVLKEGGIDGEGHFHLERPGGPSQNVYLTSSTVDLSKYIDQNVRVWGETYSAEKAGWLMDVGSIEVLE